MKVLVIGAGGIVGQEMQKQYAAEQTVGIEAVFTTRVDFDMQDSWGIQGFLDQCAPDVIVNLSGENRVDVVEADPDKYDFVNSVAPFAIASWCRSSGAHLIQCSTQAVFSGNDAPYGPYDPTDPITHYGRQKAIAEHQVGEILGDKCTIARLTFVYGIRPNMGQGRPNPLEDMMSKKHQLQVGDRFFSPLWSHDAASILLDMCHEQPGGIHHLGEPISVSRFTLACECAWVLQTVSSPVSVKKVSHNYFEGIAERPKNTSWKYPSRYETKLSRAILECYIEWKKREPKS